MVNVLVIAAHPDDECLGLAGTLLKHIGQDAKVHACAMSRGVGSRGDKYHEILEREILERERAMLRAREVLGITSCAINVFPDNKLDTVPLLEIVKYIEENLEYAKPDIIYTHSPADLNIDHRRTFEATMTACRPGHTCVKEIYSYEVPSSTEWGFTPFKPNLFVDIAEYEEKKLEALKCYHMELRPYPHPRSIEGIKARHRYWGSVSGLGVAEAFEVVRIAR